MAQTHALLAAFAYKLRRRMPPVVAVKVEQTKASRALWPYLQSPQSPSPFRNHPRNSDRGNSADKKRYPQQATTPRSLRQIQFLVNHTKRVAARLTGLSKDYLATASLGSSCENSTWIRPSTHIQHSLVQ